jgi:CRISPR-associated protein Cmr2
MKTDYYIEVEHRVRDLATQYNSDMDSLEQEKKQCKQNRKGSREIDQRIVSRKQQLLHDLKENATISSQILASGVVDRVTTWWVADLPRKLDAQDAYRQIVAILDENAFKLPDFIENPHWPEQWPPNWFGIDVSFTLATTWYSKDDRPFHVLDNPVRKDRVFGVPFMSAASWKGLLRWACRMQAGLLRHLETYDMKMDDWEDPDWIIHLFGNVKGEPEDFSCGALVFYPTWFNKVGFEVINPHSRTRRAGTQPIYYEVVPAGTKGRLRLLYAPLPGEIESDKVTPADFIYSLIDSIRALLQTYGISAKRTAGWGTARIDTWTGFLKASDEPAKVEPRSAKKTLHSPQDLSTPVHEQASAGCFTHKDAEEFKAQMKSRIVRKGGDQ